MPSYVLIPLVIVVFVIILILIGGLYIALKITKPTRKSLLESSIIEKESLPKIMDFYKQYLTDEYTITTRDGIKLQAYYFKNLVDSNKFIVMSHGHTYTHHGCLKYARMMMQKGYNIVTYDQRYHGVSEGRFTTLGHKEKDDLYDVITDTYKRYGDEIVVGTYGESMGAATVLLEAENDSRVQFVFSDCAFENLDILLDEIIQKNKYLPNKLFKPISNLFFRLISGSYYNGISPIKAIKSLNIPIFFAHGEADDFINVHHSVDLYESYNGPKEIFLAGNEANHAGSYVSDTMKYEKAVDNFVKEYIQN